MNRLLNNYLLTSRRHVGLSQEEIAFLLGSESGPQISKHESFERVPTLEAALAYELVYGLPVRELFAGVFLRIEVDVRARAEKLIVAIENERHSRQRQAKLETLSKIASNTRRIVIPSCEEI